MSDSTKWTIVGLVIALFISMIVVMSIMAPKIADLLRDQLTTRQYDKCLVDCEKKFPPSTAEFPTDLLNICDDQCVLVANVRRLIKEEEPRDSAIRIITQSYIRESEYACRRALKRYELKTPAQSSACAYAAKMIPLVATPRQNNTLE